MFKLGDKHQEWTILAIANQRFDSRQPQIVLGESDKTYRIWTSFTSDPEAVRSPHYWPKTETSDPLDIMRLFAEIVLD
jgi:hypothetical protein